jgi:predicted nucleic-acid-binding protein
MPSLDTNCLLRFILGDDTEQTPIITTIINSKETLAVADAALIETIFVLEKIKKINRATIEKAILVLFDKNNILCNRDLFIETLHIYINHPKLSFVDCYLYVVSIKTGTIPLITFDRKIGNQLSGTKLLTPDSNII